MWFCFLGERDDRETGRVEEEEKRRGDVLNEKKEMENWLKFMFGSFRAKFAFLEFYRVLIFGGEREFFIIFLNIANVKKCESFKFYKPSYEKVKKKKF